MTNTFDTGGHHTMTSQLKTVKQYRSEILALIEETHSNEGAEAIIEIEALMDNVLPLNEPAAGDVRNFESAVHGLALDGIIHIIDNCKIQETP
jgi:hypothetical protein